MRLRSIMLLLAAVAPLFVAAPAIAGTISSGAYDVQINGIVGNLNDQAGSGVIFRRNADGYDPIIPGTPRAAWGVSASGVSGFADGAFFGNSNLVANGSTFLGSSATVSTFLDSGSGSILRIDQAYSFAAANVLKICTTVTNVSGSAQAVLFAHNVDWDVAPTPFSEIIKVDPLSGNVIRSSFYGFENPDPTVLFGSNAGPAGGTFGPGDLGGGLVLDLGTLAAGASSSFVIFHALNDIGQDEAGLRAQLTALGASFLITGIDSAGGSNVAALGVGPKVAVPEPATMTLLGLGVAGLFGYRARSRKVAVA